MKMSILTDDQRKHFASMPLSVFPDPYRRGNHNLMEMSRNSMREFEASRSLVKRTEAAPPINYQSTIDAIGKATELDNLFWLTISTLSSYDLLYNKGLLVGITVSGMIPKDYITYHCRVNMRYENGLEDFLLQNAEKYPYILFLVIKKSLANGIRINRLLISLEPSLLSKILNFSFTPGYLSPWE